MVSSSAKVVFGVIWLIAVMLAELNAAIRIKLKEFVNRPFQKKEGSRYEIFRDEELPLLAPLPAAPYELAEWKQATVQYNYHISVDGMLYSVPYEYIKRKVDVRVTASRVEVFYVQRNIASHRKLAGRKGQYSTVTEHMPQDHQEYLEWNGDRFRKWAFQIGPCTGDAINAILASQKVEQQSYRSCMGVLKLAERYSSERLEAACKKALVELEEARKAGTYVKVQKKYANPVLLIIDEWLLLKPTETKQHDILELLHRRRKRSSTILCSQYADVGWYDQLGGDKSPLAEAILDRIKYDAYKINIVPVNPENYRSMREIYGMDPASSE